jgi:hypothetical protein
VTDTRLKGSVAVAEEDGNDAVAIPTSSGAFSSAVGHNNVHFAIAVEVGDGDFGRPKSVVGKSKTPGVIDSR